jgi:hypothetical protein
VSDASLPPSMVRARRLEDRTWTVATRSAPVVVQVILGLLLISTWLLGRWSLVADAAHASRVAVLGATGIAVVLSLGAAVGLFDRESAVARGLGLSTAACAAIVLIGAVAYAFWLL